MEDRKTYWNKNYYEYWKSRVEEAKTDDTGKSKIIANDAKTGNDEIYVKVFNKYPFNKGNILDVGCAWGRMFDMYSDFGLDIYGVDISQVMVLEALKAYRDKRNVKEVKEAEAEHLPYEDNFFDNLTCLATFDATFQHEALGEFFRVLKQGGRMYLTGKNTRYHDDDEVAMAAEIGARGKGHPNFFTDIPLMLEQLKAGNHTVIASYYFLRRGDFAAFKYESQLPERFYEWLLILEKGNGSIDFEPFSDGFSKTFKNSQ